MKYSLGILLHFALLGIYTPLLSMYLKNYLYFSGKESGFIISMSVLASIISPILGIYVVGRLINRKNMLILCYSVSTILMFILYFQSSFLPFLILYTFLISTHFIAQGLLNAIIFDEIESSNSSYGNIRLWGTVGWVLIGLCISFLVLRNQGISGLSKIFLCGSFLSLINLFFSFLIKDKAVKLKNNSRFKLTDIRNILENKKLRQVILFFSGGVILSSYYYFGVSPFLLQIGVKEPLILPAMFVAQTSEVLILVYLTPIIRRLNYKKILIIGIFAHISGFIIFSIFTQQLFVLLIGAFLLHGIAFGLYLPGALILIDKVSRSEDRTVIHQLTTITIGVSGFLGNNLAGVSMDYASKGDQVNYISFWSIATAIAIVLLGFSFINKLRTEELLP